MNTITPLSPIPFLGSSTSRQGGRTPEGQGEKQGEILKATVIETRPNDRYLLDFSGTRILASSHAPLTVGQQLQLQVAQTTPQVELKIVSDFFSVLAGKSLVLLGSNVDLTGLFSSLQQGSPAPLANLSTPSSNTLETFLPTELRSIINSSQGGEFLRRLFNRLGFNLENMLAHGQKNNAPHTLKAALLEIAHRFQGAENIAEQANKLLATLELYQLAQLQLNQEKLLIFPLPLPFLEQGYLLVEQSDKEQQQPADGYQDLSFSLHLSMSELGNITVNFLHSKDGLLIRFNLDSKEKVEFVSQFEDILKEAISSVDVISLTFSDSAGDPAAELVRRLMPGEESILDTTV